MFQNLGLKILALVLAGFFWVFVVVSTSQVRSFPVEGGLLPEVFNLPEGLVVAGELPEVSLKLNADKGVFDVLTKDNFAIFVDLKGRSEGEHEVKITATMERPDVTIQRVEPSVATVKLEGVASKMVGVRVKVEGEAAESFRVGEPILEFTEVAVKGAASRVNEVSEAVVTVTLSGEEEGDVLKTWPMEAVNAMGEVVGGIGLASERVAVTVPLERIKTSKTVGVRVNVVGAEENENYYISRITTDPMYVEVVGAPDVLENIDVVETEEVDVGELERDVTRPVEWVLPEGVEMGETVPRVAVVLVEVASRESVKEFLVEVQVEEGWKVTPQNVKVSVGGALEDLEEVGDREMNVVIGEEVKEGEVELAAEMIKVPEGLRVLSWEPEEVTLEKED